MYVEGMTQTQADDALTIAWLALAIYGGSLWWYIPCGAFAALSFCRAAGGRYRSGVEHRKRGEGV